MHKHTLRAAVLALFASLMANGQTTTSPRWKFPPSLTAAWAQDRPHIKRDTTAAAAGLCRSSPFNTLGVYAPLGTNVDLITGDRLNNSGFSNFGCTTAQNETTVAVNPTNPRNLIAGTNDYRVCCDSDGLNDGTGWAYYSFDGGLTWANMQLPGLTVQTGAKGVLKNFDSAGDPVVAFSPDGVAYYANIAFNRNSFASGVMVSVSGDGGRTWSAPNVIAYVAAGNFFHDKEWIAAGANGKVVVTWTRFSLGPHGAGYRESPIVGAFSPDYGKTWQRQSFPVSDPAHPFNQGSQVQYGPDGALYVSYEGASPSTGYNTDALVLARSLDDGRSFETRELARVYDDLDCYPVYGGRQTLTDMHFRLNSYPSMSVDPVTGGIAIVWADNQGSGNCGTGAASFTGTTSSQVKLVRGTWPAIASAPVVRVTTSAPDKVFPAVAARGGKIAVTYYTRDYGITSAAAVCNLMTGVGASAITPVASPRPVCVDYAAKTSADGFGAQIRLSSASSNPFVQFADGAFIGDYTQVAMGTDGVAHPVWTDFRGNPGITSANQDAVTQSYVP